MDPLDARMKAEADECESEGEPQMGTHLTDNNSNPPSIQWMEYRVYLLLRNLV